MSNLTSEWKKWRVRAEACSSSIWIRDLVSSKRILGRSSPRRSCGRVASWRVIPRRWGRDSTSSGLDWGGGLYWNAKAAWSGQSFCVDGVLGKVALQDIQTVQKTVTEENAKFPLYLPPLSILAVGFLDTVLENIRQSACDLQFTKETTMGLHDQFVTRRWFGYCGQCGVGVCDNAHKWISEHEKVRVPKDPASSWHPNYASGRLQSPFLFFVGRSFRRGVSGAGNQILHGGARSQYVKQRLWWSKAKAGKYFSHFTMFPRMRSSHADSAVISVVLSG